MFSIVACDYCPTFTADDEHELLSEDSSKLYDWYITKFEACIDSNRIEEFECSVETSVTHAEITGTDDPNSDIHEGRQHVTYYKHCSYTELDEKLNMVYMQV